MNEGRPGARSGARRVWDAIKDSWSKEPYQIRLMLTETTVRVSDKQARFVGIDAYETAGGLRFTRSFPAR